MYLIVIKFEIENFSTKLICNKLNFNQALKVNFFTVKNFDKNIFLIIVSKKNIVTNALFNFDFLSNICLRKKDQKQMIILKSVGKI